MRTRSTTPLLAALILAATAACSNDSGEASEPPPSTVPSTQPPASSVVPDGSAPPARLDGVLKIGVLLPQTGEGNDIGNAGINAVSEAVADINDGGGVLGQPVELVVENEGDSLTTANEAIDVLLSENVDAIIGPASSTVALDLLDELNEAGVVVCSPTASSMALDAHPSRGLFFRTIPSDSVAAQAIAQVAQNTGVDEVTLAYLDDTFGRPFAQRAMDRLDELGVATLGLPFDAGVDLAEPAQQLDENPTRTIIVIADEENGWAMLSAIAGVVDTGDPPVIIINDAMRTPDPEVVLDLAPEVRQEIQGVSPVAPWDEDDEPAGWYATNSLHCANLLALATIDAQTDDPASIATHMVDVSVAGTPCNSFSECRGFMEDDSLNINYQGVGPLVDLAADGDLARGRFGSFKFNDQGFDYPFGGTTTITDRDSAD